MLFLTKLIWLNLNLIPPFEHEVYIGPGVEQQVRMFKCMHY